MMAASTRRDCVSTRHHYVAQSYMRAWSPDGKRARVVDLRRGTDGLRGLRHTCVSEHFYRVTDAEGHPHQQVEAMLAVIDDETARLLRLMRQWQPGDDLDFEDFMSLCLVAVLQRNRTPQARRFITDQAEWMHLRAGQDRPTYEPDHFVDLLFRSRFDAADQLSTRELELWDDPKGRFITSDQPILMSPSPKQPPSMISSPYIWWPLSPTRLAAFALTPRGVKVLHRRATDADVRKVRQAVLRGAEEVLIVPRNDRDLPVGKVLDRRPQVQVDCMPVGPTARKCRLRIGWGYGVGVIDNVCKPMCAMAARAADLQADTDLQASAASGSAPTARPDAHRR